MNEQHQREEAIFDAAYPLPPEERAAYLNEACAGDPQLRQRVESLLKSHEKTSGVLEVAIENKTLLLSVPPSEKPGDRIGHYKLLQQIGEGGCGVVYMAEQEEPVRRRVALKIIKLGMDTKSVIARFEAERQALAMMDHPNIAKVFDAGATDTGRPYFVMELVRGVRITDYCDEHKIATEERLKLFLQVCQAIQHAHQKGVIHRDIKPSNVLVTINDGVPVPKVIDFGIAKSTQGRLTDQTLFTAFEQFIGTPAYMSPEKAVMTSLDIDTRSDIYSLGVLLYELLTGRTPFDQKELLAAGLDEMRRTIREKEPPRPSTRLSTMAADALTTTANHRHTDLPKLIHLLRGDLDWIVMKALDKDRTRRYETANGLAMDIQRHLSNEPVVARPPTAAYRFQKAYRRNKLVFTAATVVIAALATGIAVSTWQAVRAKRAQALALQSRQDAEKLANFMLDDFYAELEPSGQFETIARLARQAVAYYDNLPASVRTSDTQRNRAMAQARLALVTARQGDFRTAMPISQAAAARLEQMHKHGDQSDGTVFSLGLALEAQYWCYNVQLDTRSLLGPLQQAAATLRPFAISAEGSRRIKLEYANLLNYLSHTQPPEQGVATCEEASRILAGMGALDLSDLSAASGWADIGDSEAREALAIGRVEDAERLEKQVQTLTEGVLARRPGDLRARQDLAYSFDLLALIEARRFHDAAALLLFGSSRQAWEEYLRFNPSDVTGWINLTGADYGIAALLFRDGRVTEASHKARAALQMGRDRRAPGDILSNEGSLWLAIARREAQRGDRDAADQALQEARRSLAAFATRKQMPNRIREFWVEHTHETERQVRLAFGEDATVLNMTRDALPRIVRLRQGENDPETASVLLFFQRQALDEATRAALKLVRFAEAETTARTLLSLPFSTGDMSERLSLDQPDDVVWSPVLLAQAVVEQGRNAEALKTLEPALAYYRNAQVQGATHLTFRQHFARALYVRALAEPTDGGGTAQRRDSLDQAGRLLHDFSDEAKQLHDSKELLSWITAAQRKLSPEAETHQP